VSEATVSAGRYDLSHTLEKKIQRGRAERDEFLRTLWRIEFGRIEFGRIDAERVVFVDERWEHPHTPLLWLPSSYAYAPVGERAFFEKVRETAG
jgi:hypothetical protein